MKSLWRPRLSFQTLKRLLPRSAPWSGVGGGLVVVVVVVYRWFPWRDQGILHKNGKKHAGLYRSFSYLPKNHTVDGSEILQFECTKTYNWCRIFFSISSTLGVIPLPGWQSPRGWHFMIRVRGFLYKLQTFICRYFWEGGQPKTYLLWTSWELTNYFFAATVCHQEGPWYEVNMFRSQSKTVDDKGWESRVKGFRPASTLALDYVTYSISYVLCQCFPRFDFLISHCQPMEMIGKAKDDFS